MNVLGNSGLEIAIISVFLALVSRVIQVKFGKKKEMNAIQQRSKEKQKRLKELENKTDAKSKEEAEKIRQQMMQDMSTMMNSSTRMMLISLVVFAPALALLAAWYSGKIIPAPIDWLVFHRAPELPWFWVEYTKNFNWFSWYLWTSIITGIVIGFVFKKLKWE